ncbi:MAG: LiaI-LiaF-like domain-containing protein [Actinomycetota bacterium]
MGAAILITLGVLFLLDTNWIISFDKTWPVLLLVIGGFTFFCRTASTANHIDPYPASAPMNAAQPNTWNPAPPPPPPAPSAQQNPEVKP